MWVEARSEKRNEILISRFLLTSSLTSQFYSSKFFSCLLSRIKINKQKKIVRTTETIERTRRGDTNLDPSRLDHVFNTFTLLGAQERSWRESRTLSKPATASLNSFTFLTKWSIIYETVSRIKHFHGSGMGDTSRVRIVNGVKIFMFDFVEEFFRKENKFLLLLSALNPSTHDSGEM